MIISIGKIEETENALPGESPTPHERVQTPEERARAFFESGGSVGPYEPPASGPDRRRWKLAGLVGAVVVAGVLVALAVEPSGGGTSSQQTKARVRRTTTTVLPKPTTTTTTAPLPPNTAVTVQVLNASGSGQLATNTASALKTLGFAISGVNNAPSVIAPGQPSDIFYGPTGLPAAHTLANVIVGAVSYIPDASLTGNNVSLWIANAQMSVSTTTTTTSGPGATP